MAFKEKIKESIKSGYARAISSSGNIIAFSISVFFSVIFTVFSMLQYYSLDDSAYDLGMHAQMIESFFHGELFYSPLIGESLFAEHFTLFEFFQVPIYAIYSSPISLLIFENVFVAFGGYLLYCISKHLFSKHIRYVLLLEATSIIFLVAYEFSPYTQSLVSFPFHSMAFLPFFFLLAIYSFLKEKRILHFFSLFMIITLHSNFVYIVGILLFYELIFLHFGEGKRIQIWLSKRHDPRGKRQFLYFLVFLVFLYLYILFAGFMKGYISGSVVGTLVPGTGATGAAADSPLGILILLFTNQHSFLAYIMVNSSQKLFYINLMFYNTGYLSFISPTSLILTIPYLLYALPTSYSSYYQLGYQYSSMLVGPVFFGSVIGLCNLAAVIKFIQKKLKNNKMHNEKLAKKIVSVVVKRTTDENSYFAIFIVILMVITVAVIPYGILSPSNMFNREGNSQMQDINYFSSCNAATFLINEANKIPKNAFILTQNTLMSYFSNDINTYSTPWSPGIYSNLSKFTYIIFQYNSYWATTTQSTPSLQAIAMNGLSNGTYSIIASFPSSGIFVLEKNKN